MKIGIVIVTFKRYEELDKTLLALFKEGVTESDILVVDNNSPEGYSALFYKKFLAIKIIHEPKNISSSGGFAKGMAYWHQRGYDWTLLFNDDSRPKPKALKTLVDSLETLKFHKVGMIKLGNFNEHGQAVVLEWNGVRRPRFVPPCNKPEKCDLVTFDGCLINSKLMDQVGYCDPEFFMGTYEFDYCLRSKDAGFEIFTLPNGLIEDGKLGSVGGTPPWRQYYNTRNHLWLGLRRKELKTVWAWFVREIKFTYAILRWEDQKVLRLKIKYLATWHALIGKRGKVLNPESLSYK